MARRLAQLLLPTWLCAQSWSIHAWAERTPEVALDADENSRIYSNGDLEDEGPRVPFHSGGGGRQFRHAGPDSNDSTPPFSGAHSYSVVVGPTPTPCKRRNCNDRAEQKLLRNWKLEDGPHFFAFALFVPQHGTPRRGWLMPTQWWQSSPENPPLFFALTQEGLDLVRRYDPKPGENLREVLYSDKNFKPDSWHYYLLKIDFGLEETGKLVVWKMNLESGKWKEELRKDRLTLGWKHQSKPDGQGNYPRADGRHLTWKVGTYRAPSQQTTELFFDNLHQSSSWEGITRSLVLGHRRNLVSLAFEKRGWVALDSSKLFNNDWTQNNDGALIGATRNSDCGSTGHCIELDGKDDFVRVPVQESWFSIGQQLTLGAYFSTTSQQKQQGLLLLDRWGKSDKEDCFKAGLFLRDEHSLQFAVRYADRTMTKITVKIKGSLLDGKWRHVLGTYNRFARDGRRLKLYLNGRLVASGQGKDLALLKPKTFLLGGSSSVRFFNGKLDELSLFNFALHEDEVHRYLQCLEQRIPCSFSMPPSTKRRPTKNDSPVDSTTPSQTTTPSKHDLVSPTE